MTMNDEAARPIALCDKLVASDPTLTELRLDLTSIDDAEMKLIVNATTKNEVIKKLCYCALRVRTQVEHPCRVVTGFRSFSACRDPTSYI